MFGRHVARSLCVLGLACSIAVPTQPGWGGAPVSAPRPSVALVSFAGFQPGMWRLKVDGGAARDICIGDPETLVQTHHAGIACTRLVIANTPTGATVHYSCPAAGWGRTSFKVDGPRHLTIATQGIAGNAPFDEVTDARRTGDCKAMATAR